MSDAAVIGGRSTSPWGLLVGAAIVSMIVAGSVVGLNQNERVEERTSECTASRPREIPEVIRIDPLGQLPGNRAIIARVIFPPHSCAGVHTHGGTVSVYVVSGMIRSQLQGEPPQVFGPGQSFFEPPGAVHLIAENVSDALPAEIIAFHVLGESEEVTVFGQ